eukprot:CAMPEP_0202919720 /NCGR_PEP_ID=MMETSP1392-20130828/76480_1 /ASSEMBLY_ACC=CAM_ASM_000868 /TAXON_ID=225041 /ORGANISM="Chlamydomonas chlamydogama, Strain SAG 11-48b" /LENGTH=45 /DNA_ID= /DNA_START= /DNA_END= /DNA_ORIENTATION=
MVGDAWAALLPCNQAWGRLRVAPCAAPPVSGNILREWLLVNHSGG